jgi:hypothetical protein
MSTTPPAPLETMVVLLFPTRVPRAFTGFGELPEQVEELPAADAQARMAQLHDVELSLLGKSYLASRRLDRRPLGRIPLAPARDEGEPDHADVFLLTHIAGAALWECWIPLPAQPLDAGRQIARLQADGEGSPAALLRERIGAIDRRISSLPELEDGFPFTILRSPAREPGLDAILARQGAELVRLLYLDRFPLAFKAQVVESELRRDFCLREGGISLLSQRSALDLRTGEALPVAGGLTLPPRSALPLLVTIELLLIERTVLRLFHEQLSLEMPGSMQRLLDLKAAVLDGLEEYRGTVAASNRFSGEVTAYGNEVLGLDELHRALVERFDHVSFEITTRYQQTTNVLQFWLTVVFGALEASTLATYLAIVHYGHALLPIVGWAAGAGLAAAAVVTLLLRRRLG